MSYTARYYTHNAEPLLPVELRCQCADCTAEDTGERSPELKGTAHDNGAPRSDVHDQLNALAIAASDMSGPKLVDNSDQAKTRAEQSAAAAEETKVDPFETPSPAVSVTP